jgi:Cof subfamily protein (haloacid dehalogenase superfamily)
MTDKPIRLIACDIDGTLLNSQHELTSRTEHVLRRAMARGARVVLATGKSFTSSKGLIQHLGLTTPGVYVQGLVICAADGEVLHSQTLDLDIIQRITTFAEAENLSVLAYSGSRLMMAVKDKELMDILVAHHEPRPDIVGPLSRVASDLPLNKLIVSCREEKMPALRKRLREHVDGRAEVVLSTSFLLEILPLGASKGAGLAWLLDYLGVPTDEVLAIGDGENDIEMLRMAAIGVAVANAMPAVKDMADAIVASNNDDGVAQAVERYVLKS